MGPQKRNAGAVGLGLSQRSLGGSVERGITGVSAFVSEPKEDRFQRRRGPVGVFDSSPSFASTQFAKDQGRVSTMGTMREQPP